MEYIVLCRVKPVRYTEAMNAPDDRLDCAALQGIRVLQEKWVLHVVHALLDGAKGFNELARAVGCNTATLTQRLEHLEALGVVSKTAEPAAGARLGRSVYALTASGRKLERVIRAIEEWAGDALPGARPGADPAPSA